VTAPTKPAAGHIVLDAIKYLPKPRWRKHEAHAIKEQFRAALDLRQEADHIESMAIKRRAELIADVTREYSPQQIARAMAKMGAAHKSSKQQQALGAG
jgi:hypothetical protein